MDKKAKMPTAADTQNNNNMDNDGKSIEGLKNFKQVFYEVYNFRGKNGNITTKVDKWIIPWVLLNELDNIEVPTKILKILKDNANMINNNDSCSIILGRSEMDKINDVYLGNSIELIEAIESKNNDFLFTSPETKFSNYPKEIEIDKETQEVKTQKYKVDNSNKDKKGEKTAKGFLTTCFISPLDWLDKEYSLNLSKENDIKKVTSKIKTTNHFNVTAREEEIYNATSYLIREKTFQDKNKLVFISYNELHKQLGNKSKLRPENKKEYEKVLYRLSWLEIKIELSNIRNRKYKDFKNYIEKSELREKLLTVIFKRVRLKTKKTSKLVDGFKTYQTELMNLHFNYSNRFYINNNSPISGRQGHHYKLTNIVKRYYHISKGKNNLCIELKLETIFDELKEFNLQKEYEESYGHKAQFIKRNILDILNKMPQVKEAKMLNGKIRIYFLF